jgi:hypothetical protein
MWAIGWIVAMFGYNAFLFYWILAWGLENGGQTVKTWGAIYGVCMVQDIILCECVKIFISFNLAITGECEGEREGEREREIL